MYGKELFQKGIYGVKYLAINKIVYIGSTQISFISRWGQHSSDLKYDRHCNKGLTNLFKSGNFEFVVIEAGEFTNKELLEKKNIILKNMMFQKMAIAHMLAVEHYKMLL